MIMHMNKNTTGRIPADECRAALAKLVASMGWRFSNLDAERAGVREAVLFDAVCHGLAKLERSHPCGTAADGRVVSVYLVFA